MLNFEEDNNGFVFFPNYKNMIVENNRTLVYLIAFENKKTSISNTVIFLPGDFVSDDFTPTNFLFSLENKTDYDLNFFPKLNSEEIDKLNSIKLVTSICLGWNENNFEYPDGTPWRAGFNDLTEEGRKLYYGIKKLHNNKEVRILTFNNI